MRQSNSGRAMSYQGKLENFQLNLRYLCGYHKSVAEVCRKLEINRQQFNKYLAGANLPSDFNMRKICQFFEVEPTSLFAAHPKFIADYEGQHAPLQAGPLGPEARFFPPGDDRLRKYCGYYYAYVVSPSIPNHIIKSITRIFEVSRKFSTKTYERIYEIESEDKYYVNKYDGMAFMYSGLLYIVEKEQLNNRGYIFTVLYPSYRSPIGYMNGMVLGISGGSHRRPFGSQIVFENVGESPDLRQMVRACGCYGFDSRAISDSVRARLLVPPLDGAFNMTPPIF
jgi:transcriptional regulator with XRE-family HTH domain